MKKRFGVGKTMKKALIVTTVSGFVPQFEMNNVKILQSMDYEVHYATNYNMPIYGLDNSRLNDTGIIRHQIDFIRSPFHIKSNYNAYKQLKKLMQVGNYDLVHCHTPMGGVLARLAAKATKTAPVLYTAHGFHFFKGASIKNWIFFYPVEKYLAQYTDVLITINKEDYKNAKEFKLRNNGIVKYIKGIGIDTNKEELQVNNTEKLQELGIEQESFVITSVGELTKRKNHRVVLEALAKINNKNIVYIICGTGALEMELKKLANELRIEDKIIFAGYRSDINEILRVSDCFVFPSLQEGLSVAVLEAMVAGLPVICSKIRGNVDLIKETKGGYRVDPNDSDAFGQAIERMMNDKKRRKGYGLYNNKAVKEFDIKKVSSVMENLYQSVEKKPQRKL